MVVLGNKALRDLLDGKTWENVGYPGFGSFLPEKGLDYFFVTLLVFVY